jgi:hypothetical protein
VGGESLHSFLKNAAIVFGMPLLRSRSLMGDRPLDKAEVAVAVRVLARGGTQARGVEPLIGFELLGENA